MNKQLSVEDRLARALRRISRAIDLHSRALLLRHGLTAPQLATLLEIERLQPVSTGTLAAEIHLGSATLTGILDRLEERGLVCRTRHAVDRRSVLLSLTNLGTRLFASAPSQLCESFQRRLGAMPDWEQNAVLSTLQRVADMMEPCSGGVAPAAVAAIDGETAGARPQPERFATPTGPVPQALNPAYDHNNPSVPSE
ncbi:MAG: MarR family transcriptional regulator [Planctomycetaceae bacterium]|nr:MarR family transcriptional regulator [Planctomycetaceae bacterium]